MLRASTEQKAGCLGVPEKRAVRPMSREAAINTNYLSILVIFLQ